MILGPDLTALILLLYVWLGGWAIWGLRRLEGPRALFPGGRAEGPSVFPRPLELLWLATTVLVVLFPVAAISFPQILLAPAATLRFEGDVILQVLGALLVAGSSVLVGSAFRALGRFTTVEIRLAPDQTIVRSGPYRWIRHPMYTANMLLSAGFALLFLSPLLLLPFGLILILALARAGAEERLFLSSPRFGGSYAAYRDKTGRFVPGFCPLRRRGGVE